MGYDVEAVQPTVVSSLHQFVKTTLARRGKLFAVVAVLFLVGFFGGLQSTSCDNSLLRGLWDGRCQDVFVADVIPEWVKALPPDDPTPEQLPPGSTILPDVDVDSLPPPSSHKPFPNELLKELYLHQFPDRPDPQLNKQMREDAFVLQWSSPDWFDDARNHNAIKRDGIIPRLQHDFSAEEESKLDKELREERKEAVKRGFVYAWQKYKDYAWGHDEVRPVTKTPSDPFQNWGASIIDSLETLLIMGLSSEYDLCRPHVNQLDLRLINGRDWERGSRVFFPDGTVEYEARKGRDSTALVGTFETGIRYLGGLIGAYDLSGDELMLERAEDLARLLCKGFETSTGLLMGKFDAGSQAPFYQIGRVSLAEVGSMTLELTRLSQITGNKYYFDRAQRAIDHLEQEIIPKSVIPPLLPTTFDGMSQFRGGQVAGTFSFGGLADSYYEYLIKQHQLIGGATDQYRNMYTSAIDVARGHLFHDIEVMRGWRDLTTIAASNMGKPIAELEHLTCFAGAMLGLGARLLDREEDLDYAKRLTHTCYWMGASTASGCQPEKVAWFDANDPSAFENITIIESGVQQGPTRRLMRGSPPGTKWLDKRYLGRPETIESVFYMYRLTGDRKWQDKGWRMFVSWTQAALAEGGYSSLGDVRQKRPPHSDNMESFVFAETFKYHYLLQSEPDMISLDDYVFTTEAHPLITQPNIKPGSQGFWYTRDEAKNQDLGVRERGTDAQLWTRYNMMQGFKAVRPGGSGRGMGGPQPRPIGMPPPPPLGDRPAPIINKNRG